MIKNFLLSYDNYIVAEIFKFLDYTTITILADIHKKFWEILLQIDIKGIKGFVLSAPWERSWHSYYAARQDVLSRNHEVDTEQLIVASKDISLEALVWFFERFGWLEPSKNVIRQDQENLIKGRF